MNKEICKKCINETSLNKWCSTDESWWKKGMIDCPFDTTDQLLIKDDPPERCRYVLEHTVLGKNEQRDVQKMP